MKIDCLEISYTRLAQVVASTDMSGYETSFYISGPANSLHLMVVNAFSRYLIKDNEFDYCRAAALLDCDPALFSLNDVKLAIRAIWKSDRVGFYQKFRRIPPPLRWCDECGAGASLLAYEATFF